MTTRSLYVMHIPVTRVYIHKYIPFKNSDVHLFLCTAHLQFNLFIPNFGISLNARSMLNFNKEE